MSRESLSLVSVSISPRYYKRGTDKEAIHGYLTAVPRALQNFWDLQGDEHSIAYRELAEGVISLRKDPLDSKEGRMYASKKSGETFPLILSSVMSMDTIEQAGTNRAAIVYGNALGEDLALLSMAPVFVSRIVAAATNETSVPPNERLTREELGDVLGNLVLMGMQGEPREQYSPEAAASFKNPLLTPGLMSRAFPELVSIGVQL